MRSPLSDSPSFMSVSPLKAIGICMYIYIYLATAGEESVGL